MKILLKMNLTKLTFALLMDGWKITNSPKVENKFEELYDDVNEL
jgi:hypothetical protein